MMRFGSLGSYFLFSFFQNSYFFENFYKAHSSLERVEPRQIKTRVPFVHGIYLFHSPLPSNINKIDSILLGINPQYSPSSSPSPFFHIFEIATLAWFRAIFFFSRTHPRLSTYTSKLCVRIRSFFCVIGAGVG